MRSCNNKVPSLIVLKNVFYVCIYFQNVQLKICIQGSCFYVLCSKPSLNHHISCNFYSCWCFFKVAKHAKQDMNTSKESLNSSVATMCILPTVYVYKTCMNSTSLCFKYFSSFLNTSSQNFPNSTLFSLSHMNELLDRLKPLS